MFPNKILNIHSWTLELFIKLLILTGFALTPSVTGIICLLTLATVHTTYHLLESSLNTLNYKFPGRIRHFVAGGNLDFSAPLILIMAL